MFATPGQPRRAARLAGAAALALVPAAAHAQDATGLAPFALPPAGAVLDASVESPLGATPAEPRAPAWTFRPAIGAQELFNDNIYQTESDRRADLITAITPELEVHGDTPRLNLDLRYAPVLEFYTRTPSADAVAQNLLGTATATLVPETLFVNARALASVQPSGGGLGGLGDTALAAPSLPAGNGLGTDALPGVLALGKENRAQTASFAVTPYAQHRFGTFGTGKVGVTLSASVISADAGTAPIPGTVSAGTQRQETGEATAQFQSGEAFGRVRDFVLLDAARSSGTGVLAGAHADIATNWVGYAVNRVVTPFAEFGAESISYNTVPRVRIDDAVWELGVVLTPNAESQISIGYGHHQGIDALDIRGYYALSARTRLTVSYTTALASEVQLLQSQLGLAAFDALGNPVDQTTGAPLFLGNGLLSTQDALFRNRTLSLTATTLLGERDSVALSLQHQQQTPIGSVNPAERGVGEDGTTLGASWTHQLSELTSLGASASYTRITYQVVPTVQESVIGATVGASHRLSETVTTFARYALLDRASGYAGRSFTDNVVLIGIRKQF
ncbi:MAG: outer membrane beta-barrel protein [Acetobacteraceae bacterium]|nr:outer membrane beta-barrel protein [Acetobacteraceae bacterium]